MKKFLLSVVIPSYNEMANLQKGTLEKVHSYLSAQKYDFEVLVVDDGSDDGSREFVKEFVTKHPKFRLIENQHTGKAGAVTNGMLKASGDYVLFTDMDQATPIEEIEKLLPYISDGFDMVIGSRKGQRKGAPLTRKIMAKGMITLRSLLVGFPEIEDTQCGFKLFTGRASKDVFSKVKTINHGFSQIKGSAVTAGFDVELLYLAKKNKLSIKEVPVRWLYVETRRVNPLTDSIKGLVDLVRIKKNILSGKYK